MAIFVLTTGDRVSFDGQPQTTKEPDYWAFQKFSLPNPRITFNSNDHSLELLNLDLGPFGAAKLEIEIRSSTSLVSFKENVRIYYDHAKTNPGSISFEKESKNKDNTVLTFEISSPIEQHGVYIYFPIYYSFSDIKAVQFYTGDPIFGQEYYITGFQTGRAFTLSDNDRKGNFATYRLRNFPTQKFKFEKVYSGCQVQGFDSGSSIWDGGFKIIPSAKEDTVVTVKDSNQNNEAVISAERFSGTPNQVWYIQEYQSGFRFRPKFLTKRCLDVIGYDDKEGAAVSDYECSTNVDVSMIWVVLKAC